MPRLVRASRIVLIVGAVLCAAAAFGPVWVVRAGVVLAIATAVVSVALALRQITAIRRENAARLLKMTKDHGAALSSERTRNAEVVQVLTDRVQDSQQQSAKQRIRIGQLNAKVTELTGDNATLRSDLKSRDITIAGLRETVRSRNTEIQLLRADLDLEAIDATVSDVHALPRHVSRPANGPSGPESESETARTETGRIQTATAGGSVGSSVAGGGELWTDADHPTVVDMRAVAIGKPNLEVEQRKHA